MQAADCGEGRVRFAVLLAALLAVGIGAANAQQGGAPAPVTPELSGGPSALLVVDQDRLYGDSQFGAASQRLREADEQALEEENRRIEAALEAEERGLTDQRATLPVAEFRALAAAFDARVEDIRSAQDGKARNITRRRDDDRKQFFATAVPVLADLMGDLGAVALIDTSVVLLSLDRINITDAAIARIDAMLGEGNGTVVPAPQPTVPAPGRAETTVPAPVPPVRGAPALQSLPAPVPSSVDPAPPAN